MSSKYAANTTVSMENSLGEIKRVVQRFGCTSFAYKEDAMSISILFEMRHYSIMMRVDLPPVKDFLTSEAGRRRTDAVAWTERDKECRRRMRSLAAVIKAKLIAVDDNVASLEQEFLPYIQLPNGGSIGDVIIPQLGAITTGALALPAPPKEKP